MVLFYYLLHFKSYFNLKILMNNNYSEFTQLFLNLKFDIYVLKRVKGVIHQLKISIIRIAKNQIKTCIHLR